MKTPRKFYKLHQKQKRSIWKHKFKIRCKEAYDKFVDRNFEPLKPLKDVLEKTNLKENFDSVLKSLYTKYRSDTFFEIEKLYGCYDQYLPNLNSPFQKYIEEECKKYKKTRSDYNGN